MFASSLRWLYRIPLIGSGFPIENISLIRPTHHSLETSVASECQIPVLNILLNESFKKIFRYTISCYGRHENNPLFNLIVNDLILTSDKTRFSSFCFNLQTKKPTKIAPWPNSKNLTLITNSILE